MTSERETLPASLTRQLIAYIGNKRRLLPFLAPILRTAMPRENAKLLDLMSGSGAVSRLARHVGFQVFANDWETFAWTVTAAYLENTAGDLDQLFVREGGVRNVVDELNRIGHHAARRADPTERGYVAQNFAPADTDRPRIGRERLFYTAENARFIDAVRDEIDVRYPDNGSEDNDRRRRILISLLVYEASNHANTSGVFKAYHRGFGGHGRDALPRILSPMKLECPTAVKGPRGRAWNLEAREFARLHTADVCYLDPPYNAHQYGSNYFLLNSIARWDRPQVDNSRDSRGYLLSKAGIRSDWTSTRSPYCYRSTAVAALSDLLDAVDCRTIVVSYSGSGVVSADEAADLLSTQGRLTLFGTGYTAYRGGRQSLNRVSRGQELVFVVDRAAEPGKAMERVSRALLEMRVRELLRSRFVPDRLRAALPVRGDTVEVAGRWTGTDRFYRIIGDPDLSRESGGDLEKLAGALARSACLDHGEEFEVLCAMIADPASGAIRRELQRRVMTCLRKYAHRKYATQFGSSVERLRSICRGRQDLETIREGLDRMVEQAHARFGFSEDGE